MLGGGHGLKRAKQLKLNLNTREVGLNLILWNGLMPIGAAVAPIPSEQVHSLSILLDPGWLLGAQVAAVVRGVYSQLRQVHHM